MLSLSAIRTALPPELDAYLKRGAAMNGAPMPLQQLNGHPPSLGPYVMDKGGAFIVTVYTGPSMHFSARAKLGTHVNTTA